LPTEDINGVHVVWQILRI